MPLPVPRWPTMLALRVCVALLAIGTVFSPSYACKCAGPVAVCAAFQDSDLVFTGRVESVEPDFDIRGFISGNSRVIEISKEEAEKLEKDDSPQALKRLKEFEAGMVPQQYRARLSQASSRAELESLMKEIVENGKRTRFRVQEIYKGPKQDTIDVWMDFSDCSLKLLPGETYLVYANRNKKGRFEPEHCSRSNRLSDAGEDLAYLYFVRHGGAATGRLYGFVTNDESDLKIPRLWWDVPHPVPYLILRMESNDGGRRYAMTD